MHNVKNPRDDLDSEFVRNRFSYDGSTGELRRNGKRIGWRHSSGYWYVTINRVAYKLHRVVWLWHYGCWPCQQIDHINGEKSDNRIQNLRDVGGSINQRNKGINRNNTSGFKGVSYHRGKNKFVAQIRTSSGRQYLGSFDRAEDAARAYQRAHEALVA